MCRLKAENTTSASQVSWRVYAHRPRNSPNVKVCTLLLRLEIERRGRYQDHVSPLVEDEGAALAARDLARQVVLCALGARLVKVQALGPVLKSHIGLVEDGSQLEWRAWSVQQCRQ